MQVQVFLQFILIFLVIISVVLLSSSSFYVAMIESTTISSLKNAILKLEKTDFLSDGAVDKINEIEREFSVSFEIYGKNNSSSDEYDKQIYIKCARDVFYETGNEYSESIEFKPIVDFINNDFNVQREYSDGSAVGILDNTEKQYRYFTMSMPGSDGNYLFVASVKYSLIESQAKSISTAVAAICFIIFLVAGVVFYFYITRITKPLKLINNVTQKMSLSSDRTLLIPPQKRSSLSEIDTAISNINALYESFLLAQESLREKSDFLMEQLKEKEQEQRFREEFIADTSHELKTPISIIQGYAEGVKYIVDDPKVLSEYCTTIIDECSRMTGLVVNMMSLSDIRHNTNSINFELFSITYFIRKSLQLHEKIFEKNEITVENLIIEQLFGKADQSKLPFVINNLLSNAVSYIGGKRKIIRIRHEDVGLSYRIYVFNSGNNISQEKLEKLWMSFYRNDNSRNRSDGHFGLGLSIVKAVQDAHSQQCGVENAKGGVEFWFDIAKDMNRII